MKPELPQHLSHLSGRRGFTLAELLIVIAIIAVVIALIVPALGGSRNAARASATSNLLKQVTNAAAVFSNDNSGRTPGEFTPREMAHSDNDARGMSMGENVMLGLMGYQKTGTGTALQVGPSSGSTITVYADTIGVPGPEGKQYFVPDKKYYVAQTEDLGQMADPPHAAGEGNPDQLPDLVDAWGTPILFWVQDDTYVTKPSANNTNYNFAREDAGTGSNGAKFYWMHNKCFLTATATGKKAQDQTHAVKGSMLAAQPGDPKAWPMYAFLGNPNAPFRNMQTPTAVPTEPLSGRSPFMVQSAGIDGYYLGKQDKGAKQFPLATPQYWYGVNFAPNPTQLIGPNNQYLDKNGKPTNIDVMADFDDLWSNSGS